MGRSSNITDSTATDTDLSIDIDDYETINVKSIIGVGAGHGEGEAENSQQQQQQLIDNVNRLVQSTVSHFVGVRPKYRCTLDQCKCLKEFLRLDAFERHVFSYTGIRKYECEQCTNKYITSSHLRRHRRTAHTVKIVADPTNSNNQKIQLLQQAMRSIKCKDESCRKLFLKNYSMERHYKSKHTNECKKLYECPKCYCKFQRKMRIRTHKCTPPSLASSTILTNQLMEIESSRSIVMDVAEEADEIDISNNNNNNTTTINVIQLMQLKSHDDEEEEEEQQQQSMPILPSSPPPIGSTSPLSTEEQHEKQSPLLSQQSQAPSLSISTKPIIITGSEFLQTQKIHKCMVCPNPIEFTKWSEFVAHRRTHHRAKYKCEQCLKEFVTKANRKYHMECVHPIDPNNRKIYKCTMDGCDRFYLHRRNLNHHLRTKHLTNDHCEKFKCNHERCGRILSTKQKLQLHIEKFHNINENADTANNNNTNNNNNNNHDNDNNGNDNANIHDDSDGDDNRYRYPSSDWDANKVMVLNVGAVVEMNEGSIMELNDVELINNIENPYMSVATVLNTNNTANTSKFIDNTTNDTATTPTTTTTTTTTTTDTIDDVIYIDTNMFEKEQRNQPKTKKERKQRKDAGHKKISTASILCEMRMDPIVDKMIIEGAGQNIELIKFPSDGEIIIPEQMLTDDCQILPIIEY